MLSNYRTTVSADDTASVIVTYVSTQIVRVNRDDTITLNTGGYETVTTKRKMNQAAAQFHLGYSVWQRDHQWYVTKPSGEEARFDGRSVTFAA
jgi:hypothetical protein